MLENILSLTDFRLRKNPTIYTVVITHDSEGMSIVVHDVQDTKKDRLAVARDLEAAAERIRSND